MKHPLLDQVNQLVAKTAASSLYKYVDDEGNEFYLPERKTGPLKSPYTGKTFTPKPEKAPLSEVSKELKGKTATSTPAQWDLGTEVLSQKMAHPALKVVLAQVGVVETSINAASQRSASLKKIGAGSKEDPTLVLAHVIPELETLAKTAMTVAKQLKERLT